MPADEIIQKLDIESPEGEEMVDTIINNARTIAQHNVDTAEGVADDITNGLEEAGLDTTEHEEAIDAIIDDIANEE